MRTENNPRYITRLNSLVLIGVFIVTAAVLVVPFYSAESSSLPSGTLSGVPSNVSRSSSLPASNFKLGPWAERFRSLLPIPQASETIATFAADCATPRSTFYVGETVCAQTDNVTETDRWVNWLSPPDSHVAYGGPTTTAITTNPQNFLYIPTVTGTWKATIADPSDSSIIPVDFTVIDAPPIATYNSTCTMAKTTFVLGETVCAKATGLVGYRFAWVDSAGFILQRTDITTDPQTDTFTLPATQTSIVNNTTVDNRGEWRVNAITSRGSVKTSSFFTVKDPENPAVDLSIVKTLLGDSPVEGGQVQFDITITNNGPDDAADVHFLDDTFTNATLNSVTQTAGPAFVCNGGSTADCTAALLAKGSQAKFLLNFTAGVAGSSLANTATVSSSTAEQNPADNSFTTAALTIASGAAPPACTLNCPDNINAIADTTEDGQRGTHVTYDPPTTSGTCGTVTSSPASGSFFPVGTTTVVATSDQGNGSCSFTITVTDTGTNPPTISCPANQTGNADSNCSATINVGTATATGTNVTVIGTRSDGLPMYTCDANGTNCTRNSSDAPFSVGITTITWIAYSHDVAGPYASADDEEAHRTGSASCTQTVTVNDVTPPVINATDQTVSADANCQAAVPDYSNTATDNCACSSSDTSETCQDRERIVVTQSIAAGTLLGPGSYSIDLSANDGSSNNDGAGNTTNKTIIFTVKDTTAPIITCPGNITTSNDPGSCSATVNPGTATATDNCDTNPTITGTRSDGQALNAPYPKGTTTITWTASDHASPANQSSCTQTVTVNDTENPTISCPGNITRNNDPGVCGAVVTYTTPVGSDNCPGATTVQTAGLPSGSTFPVGTTTNTFEVTDTSGHKASCSFTVTVNDVENPVISCPASFTLEPTCPSGAVGTYTTPVGTDNCPGAVTTLTAGLASGSVFPIGTTTVTYSVTDAHGNGPVSCSFTVTVKTVFQTIEDLKTSVNSSSLTGTQKQGLIAKLNAAEDALAQGHMSTACQKLADFINSVQNYIDHGNISAAVGQAWINTAAHVRNAIACTNDPCT